MKKMLLVLLPATSACRLRLALSAGRAGINCFGSRSGWEGWERGDGSCACPGRGRVPSGAV